MGFGKSMQPNYLCRDSWIEIDPALEPWVMLLQQFTVLLMMCDEFWPLRAGDILPRGVVRTELARHSPLEVRRLVSPTI
jgi:hypothetical protein